MARGNSWTNSDGLFVGFGTRDSINENAATVRTMGNVEILQFPLDWSDFPAAGTAPSVKSIPIPARSYVLSGSIMIRKAFTSAGATTLDIGLMNAAGTAIDVDAFTNIVIAKTSIDAEGDVIAFDGPSVGGVIDVGAVDAFISTTIATGPYTAGEAIITVEYLRPQPESTARDPLGAITTRNPSLFVS